MTPTGSILRDMGTSRSELDLAARIFGGLFALPDEGTSYLGPWVGLTSAARFTDAPRLDWHPIRDASYPYRKVGSTWPGMAVMSAALSLPSPAHLSPLTNSQVDVMLPMADGESRRLVLVEAKRNSTLGGRDALGFNQAQRQYALAIALKAYLDIPVQIMFVGPDSVKLLTSVNKQLGRTAYASDPEWRKGILAQFHAARSGDPIIYSAQSWRSLVQIIRSARLDSLHAHLCRELGQELGLEGG